MLEDELGVRLFERHLRGATLTPEGRRLLDRAQYLLRSFDQLKSDVHDTQGPASGPVIIGMTPNYVSVIGAALTIAIKQRFPDAQPHIVQAFSPAMHDMLRDNAVDIALLSGATPAPPPAHMLAVEPLFEDRLCLVGRAGDPLLARNEIPVRQLRGLPLILTGVSRAGIRNEIEALAARQRVPLRIEAKSAPSRWPRAGAPGHGLHRLPAVQRRAGVRPGGGAHRRAVVAAQPGLAGIAPAVARGQRGVAHGARADHGPGRTGAMAGRPGRGPQTAARLSRIRHAAPAWRA